MPRSAFSQPSFAAGEVSPWLRARTDVARYFIGLRQLQNALVMIYGGANRRPGSRFVCFTKGSNEAYPERLLRFKFNEEQAYVIEAGGGYFRFFMDHAQIMDLDDSTAPYEIATPYTEAEVWDITYVQSADVMYLCHPNHPPQMLSRKDHADWTLEPLEFAWGPFEKPTEESHYPGGTGFYLGGSGAWPAGVERTVLATKDFFDTEKPEDYVGRQMALFFANPADADPTAYSEQWGVLKFLEVIDKRNARALCLREIGHGGGWAPGGTEWRLGAWWKAGTWPGAVFLHQQRLVMGGSLAKPDTLWASQAGDYPNFFFGIDPGDGYQFTLGSAEVNAIRQLTGANKLMALTAGSEWAVSGSATDAIAPDSIFAAEQSSHGVNLVRATKIGQAIIFCQRMGRKLRQLLYSFETDGMKSVNLTVFSDHITKSGVVDMAYAQELDSVLWCVREDGVMAALTYEPDQQVLGWSRHVTDGKYRAVASIPHPDNIQDDVWVVVERDVGQLPMATNSPPP